VGPGKIGSSVIFGLGFIYITAAVFSLIFSLILTFTSVEEDQLRLLITIVSFIALFIGGYVAGRKGKEKGWLLGGLTGLIYMLINFLYEYLGNDRLFNTEQIVYYVCFTIACICGGILGVNVSGGKQGHSGIRL